MKNEDENRIYAAICRNDGIKAREIGKVTGLDHTSVNRYLYGSAYMRELCYCDDDHLWYGIIRQEQPHNGLGEFCGWYGTVGEFLNESEQEWFERLCRGCVNIGRNLNDTRGLFHSFTDSRNVMRELFLALDDVGFSDYSNWEICFELRINRARYIRIFADVLLITEDKVFSLEFKMKDIIDRNEVNQAMKYCPYLEVIFGDKYDIIPALVLTAARDLYCYADVEGTDAQIPVCSGEMIFNLVDEYIGIFD